jgi:hypothetical protein
VNRQVWGTSDGVIATCGTTSASTTVQLASTTPTSAMRHLYIGRVVDIGTVASPSSVASARSITAFSLANKTITISGAAITTSSSNFVFNTSSGGATSGTGQPGDGQKELTGLQTIVASSGTLHTVNPTTYPVWVAQSYTNSGTNRPLAETMVDLAIMQNQVEAGKVIDVLVSNVGVFIAGKSVLSAYQRNIDTMDFSGGYKGIKWVTPGVSGAAGKELGWYADFDCPANKLYGLNTSQGLVCHQVQEGWQWLDDDGAILNRVQNQLAFEATLYTSMELACVQRNAHFVIGDLIESTL